MLKKMKIKKPPSKEIRGPVTLKLVIINNKNRLLKQMRIKIKYFKKRITYLS